MRSFAEPYRAWLWLAGALLVIGVVDFAAGHSRSAPRPLTASSSADDGGLALLLWLSKTGHTVSTSQSISAPCALPAGRRGALLLVKEGADIPPSRLSHCILWMRRGGTVLVASDGTTAVPLMERLGIHLAPVSSETVQVVQPILLRPPVGELAGKTSAVVASGPPAVVVASSADGPVLLRYRVGRGEMWLLTAPQLIENAYLSQADNIGLVANIVPKGMNVRVEEYSGQSVALGSARHDWISGSTWGVAAILAFLIFLLYRGLTGVRLGPAVSPLPEGRRPASEFVVSMANTLCAARKRADVFALYQDALRRSVREMNIESATSDAGRRLAQQAEQYLQHQEPVTDSVLVRKVQDIVRFGEELERTRV